MHLHVRVRVHVRVRAHACARAQAQAACHWKFGDLESAYAYANVVQGGIERSFGSRSELLPASLLLMGLILTSLGECCWACACVGMVCV